MAYTGVNKTGQTTSVTQLAANQMPDVDEMLYMLYPYQTPLLQWLYFNKMNTAEAVKNQNGRFTWMEDELYPHQTTLTGAGITGGAASEDNIGVTSTDPFNTNDIFLVELTEQLVYVDSIDSDEIDITTLDGSNITAAATGYLRKIGSLNHEFDVTRTAVSTKEIEVENYLTIFSEAVTSSGRHQAGELWTNGKQHDEEVQKTVLEIKHQFERNFWFSTEVGYGIVDGNKRYTYGEGFLSRISTNKISYPGTIDETVFDSFLKTIFAKGSDRRDVYCGADALQDINAFVKDRYEVIQQPKPKYGARLVDYVTPEGDVRIIRNPLFEGKFTKYVFAIDPNRCKLRYMANDKKGSRKFRIEENVELPGTDGQTDKILADMGIQLPNEETCGILYPA